MTDCCEPLEFTRGATFDMSGAATLNGIAYNFTGWAVPNCQVRKVDASGKPTTEVATLTCVWLNAATGLLRIYSASSTAAWALGPAVLDVRFVDGSGNVVQTTKSELSIVEAATRV